MNRTFRAGPRGRVAALTVVLLTVAACSSNPTRTATPSSSAASAVPSALGPSPLPSASSPGPGSASGGAVAQALVKAFHASPFVAHFEESVLSSSLTNGTRITLTAKAIGDVSGPDVDIHSTATGGGPPTDQSFVAVGDVAWFRAKADPTWTVAPRTAVADSIDQLLRTIQPVDDPGLLVDNGIETLDGQSVHHLTAAEGIPFQLANGVDGKYDTFDVWATASGVPVLMKATFVQVAGINSITGGVDIRYSKVGGPIAIAPPAGAPSLLPSPAP